MTNFLEIKTIQGNIVLINCNEIRTIQEGIDLDFNFVWLMNDKCINTYETIQEIAAKI
jgi:hypothetical protein